MQEKNEMWKEQCAYHSLYQQHFSPKGYRHKRVNSGKLLDSQRNVENVGGVDQWKNNVKNTPNNYTRTGLSVCSCYFDPTAVDMCDGRQDLAMGEIAAPFFSFLHPLRILEVWSY